VGVAGAPHHSARGLRHRAAVVVADVEGALGGRVQVAGDRGVARQDRDDAVVLAGRRGRRRQAAVVDGRIDAVEVQARAVVGPRQLAVAGGRAQVDGDRLVGGVADAADRRAGVLLDQVGGPRTAGGRTLVGGWRAGRHVGRERVVVGEAVAGVVHRGNGEDVVVLAVDRAHDLHAADLHELVRGEVLRPGGRDRDGVAGFRGA